MGVRLFRDLRVYGSAVELRKGVFRASRAWPKEERYSLTDQVRRSSRSVGANIAEAWSKRRYPKHFVAKLTDAHGEAEETGVWLDTALECGYLEDDQHQQLHALVRSTAGGLATMIRQAERWSGTERTVRDPSEPYVVEDADLLIDLEDDFITDNPPPPHPEHPALEDDTQTLP